MELQPPPLPAAVLSVNPLETTRHPRTKILPSVTSVTAQIGLQIIGDRSGGRAEGGAHVTIATGAHNRSPRRGRLPLISVPSLGSAGLSSSVRLLVVYRLSVHCQCRGKNDQGRAMAAALCRLVYHDLRSIRGTNVNKRAMSPPLQFSLVERLSVSGRLSVIFQRARFVRDVFVGLHAMSSWAFSGTQTGGGMGRKWAPSISEAVVSASTTACA